MHATPKQPRFRPSLGEPSRVLRSRAQSPGASSVGSVEDQPGTSPRRRASLAVRPATAGRGGAARNSRDPRPVGDRGFAAQCARNVVDLLGDRGYTKPVTYEKLLKDPSTKEFFDIFRFLISLIDSDLEVEGKMEDEVPSIMRRLKYPVEVNRSKLQAISGPNTWPQLLAVLDFLVALVHVSEDLINPIAECQASLVDSERDDGDHHLLRTLHENYHGYITGRENHSDEESLRQIYEERIGVLRREMESLQEQHCDKEARLQAFQAEHERLLELQKAPAQLLAEIDNLGGEIRSVDSKVQLIEEETAQAEADERIVAQEIEELKATSRSLTEQVNGQPFSKKDIERLKYESSQLQEVLQGLRSDSEKMDQDVWELNMRESRRAEAISRISRQANDFIEQLDQALVTDGGASARDLAVRVDLSDSSDSLAALDFQELVTCARTATQLHFEAAQTGDASILEVNEEQRTVQEELATKERDCRRLRERVDQLMRMREEYRDWSAEQLDEARRTAEATEDAVHAVSVGTSGPSIRDAAEIDKLRLTLEAIRTQGADERSQLEEQIQRDEEKFEDHRQNVLRQLEIYAQDAESVAQEFFAMAKESSGKQGGGKKALKGDAAGGGTPKAVVRGGC